MFCNKIKQTEWNTLKSYSRDFSSALCKAAETVNVEVIENELLQVLRLIYNSGEFTAGCGAFVFMGLNASGYYLSMVCRKHAYNLSSVYQSDSLSTAYTDIKVH